MSVTMGDEAFDACATLTNRGPRARLITRPFSFAAASQLFMGFWTPDGRSASLNRDRDPSSSPVPFLSNDRFNYERIDPDASITGCRRIPYSAFDEKVVDSDVVFTPWLQPWMPLPFDKEYLKSNGPLPTNRDPLSSNTCRIDIEKRRADCAIPGLKKPGLAKH